MNVDQFFWTTTA